MKSYKVKKVEGLIIKYGLKPALRRDLSLLCQTIVRRGYTKGLKNMTGFTYDAFGAIWLDGDYQSLVNNNEIENKVKNYLSSGADIKTLFKRCLEIFQESEKKFQKIINNSNSEPLDELVRVIDLYEKYFSSLGVYNSFYRFLGDKSADEASLSQDLIDKIGRERNLVGEFFPKVERHIRILSEKIGDKYKINKEVVRFLTFDEAKKCVLDQAFGGDLLKIADERMKRCFHLYTAKPDQEFILSRKEEVDYLYERFYKEDISGDEEIKGITAYPGKVSGRVRIIRPNEKPNEIILSEDEILVAVHTNPDYIQSIKKSSAIVTDEGGILSHASVISREMKIPCIIGTKIATKVLHDGDLVEVDADKGIVRIIK